ncbi:MAG: transposase [Bacteroidales bacterium]
MELYGYVIMSNHVHLIVRAKEGFTLSDILRDFKKHTSKQIIKLIQAEPESRKEWLLQVMEEHGKNNEYAKEKESNETITKTMLLTPRQKLIATLFEKQFWSKIL